MDVTAQDSSPFEVIIFDVYELVDSIAIPDGQCQEKSGTEELGCFPRPN